MLVLRLYEQQSKEKNEWESYLAVKRIEIADFRNVHRGKNDPPVIPSELFPLSYDTQLTQESDLELFQKVARRLGSRIKGKQGEQ
jgi:hypothetical protein